MPITSQFRASPAFGDVWPLGWQQAGLLKPAAVKPLLATLEQTLIIRKLGALTLTDQTALKDSINSILG